MNTFTVTLRLRFKRTNEEKTPDTDAFFAKTPIADYIKKISSAAEFVENVVDWYNTEIVPGTEAWGDGFSVTFGVDTAKEKEQLLEDLIDTSLEDGEYESCCETGWVIYTKGNDEGCEYGLVDYRSAKSIIIE